MRVPTRAELSRATARAAVLREAGEPKTFNSAMARVEAGLWAPGYFLRWQREQVKKSLRGVAEEAGVSAPFWSDLEHGRHWMEPTRYAAVAKALGTRDDVISYLGKYVPCGHCGRCGP